MLDLFYPTILRIRHFKDVFDLNIVSRLAEVKNLRMPFHNLEVSQSSEEWNGETACMIEIRRLPEVIYVFNHWREERIYYHIAEVKIIHNSLKIKAKFWLYKWLRDRVEYLMGKMKKMALRLWKDVNRAYK